MNFKKENIKNLKTKENIIRNSNVNIITKDDIKYRQGRSKRQVEATERIMFIASICLGTTLLGIIIFGILGG